MTDFADQNVDYWQGHPWLQSYIEQGLLDFARFDVECHREFELINSGDLLSAETLKNPLVVISNYLFDSIPQDAFFVSEGRLFETLVSVKTSEPEADPDDPEILTRAEIFCNQNLVTGDYYDDPKWNRILTDYQERLPDVPFLFPTAALRCLTNLLQISNGRMLLVSGDRGYSRDEGILIGEGALAISVHGSFSLAVDYQIIGEYCRQCGGEALHPEHRAESLNISAFIFGQDPSGPGQTSQAYAQAINGFGPDDFVTLWEGIEPFYETLSLGQLLAFLRLSHWDYKRFWECLPALKKQIESIPEMQKQELHDAIVKVWDSYLPIGEENDLAFQLGTLLLELGFYDDALELLRQSVNLYGAAPGTVYNIGVCYYGLDQREQALEYVNQALELDPEFDDAKALRLELRSELPEIPNQPRESDNLELVAAVNRREPIAQVHLRRSIKVEEVKAR
jgi:hypothetical protein